MPTTSSYSSKTANSKGLYDYDAEEIAIWGELFTRQMATLNRFACSSYLEGQSKLGFTGDNIPQVSDVDQRLSALTGAGVEPVAALIPQAQFATLLSNRRFPVATFIRRREDIDYVEEPDIFHEVFGHCPMLTDADFCRFLERFGALALSVPKSQIKRLFRLFWFTVEFGLIREHGELRAFGAGIMSSPAEAKHATKPDAKVIPFNLLTMFRTDYRIDILQPQYFEINSFEALASSLNDDIPALLAKAESLGDLPRRFDLAA